MVEEKTNQTDFFFKNIYIYMCVCMCVCVSVCVYTCMHLRMVNDKRPWIWKRSRTGMGEVLESGERVKWCNYIIISKIKERKPGLGVYAFNPSTGEEEAGRSLSLRPAWRVLKCRKGIFTFNEVSHQPLANQRSCPGCSARLRSPVRMVCVLSVPRAWTFEAML